MKVGDFVKGLSGSPYAIADEHMMRGLVVDVSGNYIRVIILDHDKGGHGAFRVESRYFEVIGHVRPFCREEALKRLREEPTALLEYDLIEADLSYANLRGADLRYFNLRCVNLCYVDLRGADLRGADLCGADLCGADLYDANLRGADLSGANLDYSCWPLWCGGLHVKADKRILTQLAYIFCAQDNDDPDYLAARNAILPYANQFPNAIAWGILEPIETEES